MIVIKLEQLATTINNHIVKDALVISVFPVAVNSKYITAAPDTDVNTPAACFIFCNFCAEREAQTRFKVFLWKFQFLQSSRYDFWIVQ